MIVRLLPPFQIPHGSFDLPVSVRRCDVLTEFFGWTLIKVGAVAALGNAFLFFYGFINILVGVVAQHFQTILALVQKQVKCFEVASLWARAQFFVFLHGK